MAILVLPYVSICAEKVSSFVLFSVKNFSFGCESYLWYPV
jgi:hypothetical protein